MKEQHQFKVTKKHIIATILIGALLSNSCAVYKLRMSPLSDQFSWQYGRKVLTDSDENFRVHLSYEDHKNDQILFFAEINNLNYDPVLVDPGEFYYLFEIDPAVKDVSGVVPPVYVFNPENEIERLDQEIGDKKTEKTFFLIAACACLVTGIIAAILSGGDDDDDDDDDGSTTIIYDDDDDDYQEEIGRMENEKIFWMDQTLRKTTLSQDQTISGLIVFPVVKEANVLTVYLPVGSSTFEFQFSQEWEKM